MFATVWRRKRSSVRASAILVWGAVATSSCDWSISPIACPSVTDLSFSRKAGGISRATDLVSASTRKYSSSIPNLYSSDMVHLSRANVVYGIVRPFNARRALARLAKTVGHSGCTEAESGLLLANPQPACGDRKRGCLDLVPA